MIPELKERFLDTAEQDGWIDERVQRRVKERDIEIAKDLKMNNVPLSLIANTTKLTIQEVEAL